jgi:acyl-CoA dehydrogenase
MINDQEAMKVFLDKVARFVRERCVPNEELVAETDEVPQELVEEMKQLGMFGLAIPKEYGGLGLTVEEEVLVGREMAKTGVAFSSVFGTNNGIGSQGILIDGTMEQKRHYLPKLACGEMIGSFALTEPDSGSDAGSLRTTAVKDGDSYILNGTKRFITNAPHASIFTVMARTEPGSRGPKGVSAFIVEAGTPGLSLGKLDKKMGHRGAHTCDVIFEDCRVPAANIIGGVEGMGFKTAMKVLDKGRLTIAGGCVGKCERMLDDALRYAVELRRRESPVEEFQMIQDMLAECRAEIYATQCMVMDAARRYDLGKNVSTEAACCKLFATEVCGRVADRSVQIHGEAGYYSRYPAERFYRDVRLYRIYEGTSQIQQLVIARNMIKAAQG